MQLIPIDRIALLQFTAFVLRHLVTIDPQTLVLYFDDSTAHYANHVAFAFRGHNMHCIKIIWPQYKSIHINGSALLLNFLPRDVDFGRIILSPMSRYFVVILTKPKSHNFDPLPLSDLLRLKKPFDREIEIHAYQIPMGFYSWFSNDTIGRKMIEKELIRSAAWYAFLNRIDSMEGNSTKLTFLNKIWSKSFSVATSKLLFKKENENISNAYILGFNIGMYKIFVEKLNAGNINFGLMHQNLNGTPSLVKTLDARLTIRLPTLPGSFGYIVSLDSIFYFVHKIYHCASTTRYVVLVPRIVLTRSSDRLMEILFKCQIIAGILLSTGLFVTLRYCCQITNDDQPSFGEFITKSFFDTFSRLLGISPGTWFGRSTGERQLLSVISLLAFLFGCIFSGVLFEQMLTEDEPTYLYNNLEDICNARFTLFHPPELTYQIKGMFHSIT